MSQQKQLFLQLKSRKKEIWQLFKLVQTNYSLQFNFFARNIKSNRSHDVHSKIFNFTVVDLKHKN